MLVAICTLALMWAVVNGAQDAPNAVTTTIVTHSLRVRSALLYAALMNAAGALFSAVAISYMQSSVVSLLNIPTIMLGASRHAGAVVICSLAVSALWCALAWWRGMPVSGWTSTLAALAGSLFVVAGHGFGVAIAWRFVLSILLSPVLGFALSFALTRVVSRLTSERLVETRTLRGAQTISAGLVAFGHGVSNSRIPTAAMLVALLLFSPVSAGHVHDAWSYTIDGIELPMWSVLAIATALGLGTLVGGHRIIRTLGRKLSDLTVGQGLAAETSTALLMGVASSLLHLPVSSTQTITGSIVGSGLAMSKRAVAWGVFGRIFAWWVATPIVSGVAAMVAMWVFLAASR